MQSSPKDVATEPSGQTITMPVADQLIVSMAAMERVLMAEQLMATVLLASRLLRSEAARLVSERVTASLPRPVMPEEV